MWLYLAEIMTPRGASFAYSLNWIFVIIFALASLFVLDKYKSQKIYYVLWICCSIGILFIHLFVKETRGLSSTKKKKLYFPSNYQSGNKTVETPFKGFSKKIIIA